MFSLFLLPSFHAFLMCCATTVSIGITIIIIIVASQNVFTGYWIQWCFGKREEFLVCSARSESRLLYCELEEKTKQKYIIIICLPLPLLCYWCQAISFVLFDSFLLQSVSAIHYSPPIPNSPRKCIYFESQYSTTCV